MTLATSIAIALLAGTPVQAVETVDVAYEELAAGENEAAIRELNRNQDLRGDDPARLVNLGAAHARKGDLDKAREYFRAAIYSDDRLMLETNNGEWIDSRNLARQALARLDNALLDDQTRMASR